MESSGQRKLSAVPSFVPEEDAGYVTNIEGFYTPAIPTMPPESALEQGRSIYFAAPGTERRRARLPGRDGAGGLPAAARPAADRAAPTALRGS